MDNNDKADDIMEMVRLQNLLDKMFTATRDYNYQSRRDFLNSLHSLPDWITVELDINPVGGLLKAIGAPVDEQYKLMVVAYYSECPECGEAHSTPLINVNFTGVEDAYLCGKALHDILHSS